MTQKDLKNPLKMHVIYPDGQYNSEMEIEATRDGLLIDEYNLVSWEWIDGARAEVGKILADQ